MNVEILSQKTNNKKNDNEANELKLLIEKRYESNQNKDDNEFIAETIAKVATMLEK